MLHLQYDWNNCKKLSGNSKLFSVVDLLPMSEPPSFPLVLRFKWRPFQYMQNHQHELFKEDSKIFCMIHIYIDYTKLWMTLVKVQAAAVLRKGMHISIKCISKTPMQYESHNPFSLTHVLFGLASPCPPTSILQFLELHIWKKKRNINNWHHP